MTALQALQTTDVLRAIVQFQHGIPVHMVPLRELCVPGFGDEFKSRQDLQHINAVLKHWYAAHDLSHIPSLLAALPRMANVLVLHAVYTGDLRLVRAFHFDFNLVVAFPGALLDVAATQGHLSMVTYLHHRLDHRGCCTTRAMDGAAKHGHLEIVAFLHRHRQEGCTARAMNGAAMNGHLKVVQFLLQRRSEGCLRGAMNVAFVAKRKAVCDYLKVELNVIGHCRCITCN
ncbi:Aste57867_21019 [Aphanomyces stellatus]|uniref:Aste57867_21019 protein n=1 Tax=Aphanomyces stellatus TaxID=120398 RepID=A0A485LGE3_9STRA|nr:hypothetical protein As57867_020951 [Aphanomyces stellatus]VFT97694.1 Aste57867_21019 [Aphanomyces stellatus]